MTRCGSCSTNTDKPIVGFGRMIHQVGDDHVAAQKAAGFPFLQGIEPTIRALNGLWFHAARAGRVPAAPPPAPPSELSPATLQATLARYGIALPRSEAVASAAEAVAAAERIGFPVALKIRLARHRSQDRDRRRRARPARPRGGASAADVLVERARAAVPHARIDGFLVQEMVAGVEAIVGARSDPLYGPMLLIGSGGMLVELAKDTALRLLPVTAERNRRDGRGLEAGKACCRVSRAARRRSRRARSCRTRARAVLSRPSRKDQRRSRSIR